MYWSTLQIYIKFIFNLLVPVSLPVEIWVRFCAEDFSSVALSRPSCLVWGYAFLPDLKRNGFLFSIHKSIAFRFLGENPTGTLYHRDHDHKGWWDLFISIVDERLEENIPVYASLRSVIWPNHFAYSFIHCGSNNLHRQIDITGCENAKIIQIYKQVVVKLMASQYQDLFALLLVPSCDKAGRSC